METLFELCHYGTQICVDLAIVAASMLIKRWVDGPNDRGRIA